MTITVNGIEIESEDPKVIARTIANAKRQEGKQRKIDQENKRQANLYATKAGYSILNWKAQGKMCDRWELARVGTGYPYVNIDGDGCGSDSTYRVQPVGGSVLVQSTYRVSLRAVVVDGAGWVIALCYWNDYDGRSEVYAIGSHEGQYDYVSCFGVTIDDFVHLEHRQLQTS